MEDADLQRTPAELDGLVTPAELERLIRLDRRLVDIASWVNPSRLLNPTLTSRRRALADLRSALSGGRMREPQLEYLPLPEDQIARSHRALDQIEFGDTDVDDLLRQQATGLRLQLELLESRGTARYGEVAAEIYGLPSADLIERAEAIVGGRYLIDQLPEASGGGGDRHIDAESMAGEMAAALEEMKIRNWRVVVLDEMSARMSVSARHREVRVKTDSLFTLEDRDRLIVHELGTHVRRACRGFETGLLNLGLGLQGYIATEEGLASHLEEKNGLLRRNHVRMYAFRAIGAHLAQTEPFSGVYHYLVELGASPGIAWDVAIRVKRGLEDTTMLGGFPKDYAYLHGREIVTAFIKDGGTEEDLFLGKIAVEHIDQVKSILARWTFPPSTRHS